MAIDRERVNGQNVQVVFTRNNTDTPILNFTKFSAETMVGDDDATAAPATYDQYTDAKRRANWDMEGYVGGAETPDDLPQEGDTITAISCETTDNEALFSRINDTALFGRLGVLKCSMEVQDKPLTWKISGRSGKMLVTNA